MAIKSITITKDTIPMDLSPFKKLTTDLINFYSNITTKYPEGGEFKDFFDFCTKLDIPYKGGSRTRIQSMINTSCVICHNLGHKIKIVSYKPITVEGNFIYSREQRSSIHKLVSSIRADAYYLYSTLELKDDEAFNLSINDVFKDYDLTDPGVLKIIYSQISNFFTYTIKPDQSEYIVVVKKRPASSIHGNLPKLKKSGSEVKQIKHRKKRSEGYAMYMKKIAPKILQDACKGKSHIYVKTIDLPFIFGLSNLNYVSANTKFNETVCYKLTGSSKPRGDVLSEKIDDGFYFYVRRIFSSFYYSRIYSNIAYSELKKLQKLGLIEFSRVNIVRTLQDNVREATPEENEVIQQIEEKTLEQLGYKTKFGAFFCNKKEAYFKLLQENYSDFNSSFSFYFNVIKIVPTEKLFECDVISDKDCELVMQQLNQILVRNMKENIDTSFIENKETALINSDGSEKKYFDLSGDKYIYKDGFKDYMKTCCDVYLTRDEFYSYEKIQQYIDLIPYNTPFCLH